MRIPGPFNAAQVSAMARGKSPWGDGDTTAEADPPASSDGEPAESEARPESSNRPLNPWLPAPQSDSERRSPRIEDILRQRTARRPGGGARRNWWPIVIAGIAAAWIGGTSVHLLGKGEQGLITTFSRYDRTVGPGLTMTLPWPLQTMAIRDTARIEETVLPTEDRENLMITADRQLIDLAVKVRWRIIDLRRFAYGSADSAALAGRIVDAQVHAAVAEQTFDDLNIGRRRAELQQLIASRSQAVLDTMKLGIRIENVEVTRANPPQKLAQAFRRVGEAREAARQLVSKANGEAEKTIGDANAEAEEFESVYAQYQAAPAITRKRRYYEAMERVLVNNPKVVIVGGGAINVTPALPANSAPAPATPASGAP